jgi:hypothetical protein
LFQNELRSESEKPFQSKIENFFENFFNLWASLLERKD